MSGIYIHIPFCKQACHYCDFHFSTSMGKKKEMIKAICRELELRKGEFKKEVVQTLYFGGGTPSLLEIDELRLLIATVYEHYTVSENPEITLEANPDDLVASAMLSHRDPKGLSRIAVAERSRSYRDLGINRLSIGIQSFFDEDLKFMNRAHNAKEAEESLSLATRYFDNISIDLIYGIPGMTNERWIENIEKALSHNLPHISCYALTVEPNTALANFIKTGKVQPLDDGLSAAQYAILTASLPEAGYVCYEISNFGKPGYFSQNNTAYWQGKKYLGVGPSAHSFDGEQRSWNSNNNIKYIKSIIQNELPREVEVLSVVDRYNEYVMTGLRTIWGISLPRITLEFGKKYHEYFLQQSEKHFKEGLLSRDGHTILVTKKGKFLSDGIAADLFYVKLG